MISTFIRRAPLAALFALMLTSPAAAQETVSPEADALTRRAESLYGTPARFREAAELHVQAAMLRSVEDPRRIVDLSQAGRLFVYTGDAEEGRRAIEKAAQTALVMGDLAGAGHMYIDAAFVAAQAEDRATARRMLVAARWIASAPMLAPADERTLRRRFATEDTN